MASGRTCIKINISALFNVSETVSIDGGMTPVKVELIKGGPSTSKNSLRLSRILSLVALICALVRRIYHQY
jgi:hypothetical protein